MNVDSETVLYGLQILGVGMCGVFANLLVLYGAVTLMGRVLGKKKPVKPAAR